MSRKKPTKKILVLYGPELQSVQGRNAPKRKDEPDRWFEYPRLFPPRKDKNGETTREFKDMIAFFHKQNGDGFYRVTEYTSGHGGMAWRGIYEVYRNENGTLMFNVANPDAKGERTGEVVE